MTIKSTSGKTLSTVTGTLVLEFIGNPPEPIALEQAIDSQPSIRRLGPATIQQGTSRARLRCDVEYGPVFGGHESDLKRQAESAAGKLRASDYAVFGYRRQELRNPAAISERLAELEAKYENADLPLAAGRDLSVKIARLRQHLDSLGPVEQTPPAVETPSTPTVAPPAPAPEDEGVQL